MSALSAFRTAIAALLYDTGNVIFSTTEIDQALRWALSEYSSRRPLLRTYQYSVDATTAIHTLPADFITRHITRLDLYNEDPDSIVELAYYAYQRDEQWCIETRTEIQAGEVLQITYSAVHTIDGLDAAAGTTLPAADEILLHIGAAGHAAQMRSMGTVESINMNANVVQTYRLLAADYLREFATYLTITSSVAIASIAFPTDLVF